MLHERNEESVIYFDENKEAGFFSGPDELATQVKHFLANESLRETIQFAGYQRALKEHSLDDRAKQVIDKMSSLL